MPVLWLFLDKVFNFILCWRQLGKSVGAEVGGNCPCLCGDPWGPRGGLGRPLLTMWPPHLSVPQPLPGPASSWCPETPTCRLKVHTFLLLHIAPTCPRPTLLLPSRTNQKLSGCRASRAGAPQDLHRAASWCYPASTLRARGRGWPVGRD
ncbi:hypothetical protein HJG60_008710 [Phyllostomus discolor]|uniref:Uncharacterized protein n=1 Tax=Phyllostomus discolor TaxID=89673 RepID=A0A833YW87_9CHIR|nr:hypothetical protein HJG60_008710 [Phyllostomus discolor]